MGLSQEPKIASLGRYYVTSRVIVAQKTQNNNPKIFFRVQRPQLHPKLSGFALERIRYDYISQCLNKELKILTFEPFSIGIRRKTHPPSSEGHILILLRSREYQIFLQGKN